MFWPLKLILLSSFLLTTSLGFAENCKPLEQIQVSGFALEEFFNPRDNSHSQFLPAPKSACFAAGGSVKIIDPYGRTAGLFLIEGVWEGTYSLATLVGLKPTDIAKEYSVYLAKKNLNELSVEGFLRLVYSHLEKLPEAPILIAKGRLRPNSSYVLNWNSKTEPRNVTDVKVVGYEQVIARVGTPSLILETLPKNPSANNIWRIPKAVQLPLSNIKLPCGLWSWQDLIVNWQGINMDKYNDSKELPSIVYSTHMDPSCALNAAAFLKLHGFRDVQWFEYSSREWQRGAAQARQDLELGGYKTLTAAEVLAFLPDKNYVVIDIRTAEQFAMGHIAGAISNPLSIIDAEDFPKLGRKNPAVKIGTAPHSLASYLSKPLRPQIKTAKNVILYTDSNYPKDLTSAARDIKQRFSKEAPINILFFPGGFAEWIAFSKWQPRSGYDIQKK